MVVGKFLVGKEKWVVVKLNGGTHAMSEIDWKKTYGKLHPDKWKK